MEVYNSCDMKANLDETLRFNRQMQSKLLIIREKLEKILTNVQETYKSNEGLLKQGITKKRPVGIGIKGAYLKGGTFYLKGNMFFKDIKCRNCPNNPDYVKRKKENEMFPMDLNLQARHVWSTRNKQGVILGIKEQIIDYLQHSSKRKVDYKIEMDSEKLTRLLKMVPSDFCIDWDNISSCYVQYRHTAKACEAIWNCFLHPSLKRSIWTEEENNTLLEAAKKHNFQNWQAIADEVGQRSDFQCFVQFKNHTCFMLNESYSKWTTEEDERLLNVVAKNTVHGVINWSNVMAHFPHKAKTTLQNRYFYRLNPKINYDFFTPEEDLLLLAAVKEYGTKFTFIPRHLFPNRTLVQLRTHYNNTLLKRHKLHPWTIEDDIKLLDFVTKHGTKSWTDCEKFFNEVHTRQSCRTRFLVIKRYLEKNPDASIEGIPRKRMRQNSNISTENWLEKIQELSSDASSNRTDDKNEIETTKIEKTSIKQTNPKSKIKECEKLYIHRLRPNGIKNYNFFKYAFNFKLTKYPCENFEPNNQNFKIVISALTPKILFPLQSNTFDTCIPENVTSKIITMTSCSFAMQKPKNLPPSWSTAMGFRSLCINTACNESIEQPHLPIIHDDNNHLNKFRERLRILFYTTALLSRLDPSMVGITTISNTGTQRKAIKRKR